jgi:hypothetical protein
LSTEFEKYLDSEIERLGNEANQLLFAHHQRLGALNKLLEVKEQFNNGVQEEEKKEEKVNGK